MALKISPDLIARYGGNLPRYTSYPTAVSFSVDVGPKEAASWIQAVPQNMPLSLYFHVPFCDELCRFCACNTSVVRQEDVRREYGELLIEELHRIMALTGQGRTVRHIHFGGGTPTTLPDATLRRLLEEVRDFFAVSEDAEIAMEIDPRHVPETLWPLLKALNFTRISFGVQDLDPVVQKACGREQSFEQTLECVLKAREMGIAGVNIDLIYGLPHQTVSGVAETARHIARMKPDRLAVFGYAHVPWKQKRQQLIPQESLPGAEERLEQCSVIDDVLQEEGYYAIGLDHYALPSDAMTCAAREGRLHRNFQGYTVDSSPVLLGMGASAISMTPDGFFQNIPHVASYEKELNGAFSLPVARGVKRTEEDCLRGQIIERIMCDQSLNLDQFCSGTGQVHDIFQRELKVLHSFEEDGLVERSGNSFRLTERGRPFLRHVAAVFDKRRIEMLASKEAQTPRFSASL